MRQYVSGTHSSHRHKRDGRDLKIIYYRHETRNGSRSEKDTLWSDVHCALASAFGRDVLQGRDMTRWKAAVAVHFFPCLAEAGWRVRGGLRWTQRRWRKTKQETTPFFSSAAATTLLFYKLSFSRLVNLLVLTK